MGGDGIANSPCTAARHVAGLGVVGTVGCDDGFQLLLALLGRAAIGGAGDLLGLLDGRLGDLRAVHGWAMRRICLLLCVFCVLFPVRLPVALLAEEAPGRVRPGKRRTMVWTGLYPGLYVVCVYLCVLCVCVSRRGCCLAFLSRREGLMGWVVVPYFSFLPWLDFEGPSFSML